MRELLLLSLVAALLGLSATEGRSQRPDDVGGFMAAKLKHSQKVLEGLAVEDYKMIAKNAQELSLLSQAAGWRVLQTEEYLAQSIEFRRAADAITKAAQQENLDGAALAYVRMTMDCIDCHKYVRNVRMASLDNAPSLGR